MAEWSKAAALGAALFGGVGSNPILVNNAFFWGYPLRFVARCLHVVGLSNPILVNNGFFWGYPLRFVARCLHVVGLQGGRGHSGKTRPNSSSNFIVGVP